MSRPAVVRERVSSEARRVGDAALRRLRLRWPEMVAAIGITLFAWPIERLRPRAGLDESWQAALHTAFHEGVAFDDGVAFTRGPLGLFNAPRLYYGGTGALAIAANVLVAGLLAYAVLRLLHHRLNLAWSIAIAIPLVLVLNRTVLLSGGLWPEVCLVLVTVWACRRLLRAEASPGPVPVVALVIGSAVIMLVKVNVGLAAFGVTGYVAVLAPAVQGERRAALRNLATLAGAVLVTLPLLWMIIGQPLGALPAWLANSAEITRGHSEAMGIEAGGAWEYAAALLLVGVLVSALLSTRFTRPHDRWLLLGLVAAVSFVAFKGGFVRHDAHSLQFFGLYAVLPLAFLREWGVRPALACVAAPVVTVCAITNVDAIDLVAPGRRIDALGDVVHLARSGSNRAEFIDGNRQHLRDEYALSPAMLERLAEGEATVMPWELTVTYAYPELDWRLLPVIQTYNAYTTELDRMNARFLAADSRPEFVLNEPGPAIDGRLARWESPEAMLALVCNYRVVEADARWQLLRATEDRCGEPEEVARVTVGPGQVVGVPPATADSLVVARFDGIADGTFDAVRAFFYKAREVYMEIDEGAAVRFLPSHQDALHVLATPPCAGEQLDGETALTLETIELSGSGGGEHYGIEFLRVPFSC